MKKDQIVCVVDKKENFSYFKSQNIDIKKQDIFVVVDPSFEKGLGEFLNKRTNKTFIAFKYRFKLLCEEYDPNQEPEDDCL